MGFLGGLGVFGYVGGIFEWALVVWSMSERIKVGWL